MKQFLGDNTYISLTLLASVIGVTVWITRVEASALHALADADRCAVILQSIDQRLARIEGKLEK